jgi:hypothetical protein
MGNAPSAAPDVTGALSHEIIGTRIVTENHGVQVVTTTQVCRTNDKLKNWRAFSALYGLKPPPVLAFAPHERRKNFPAARHLFALSLSDVDEFSAQADRGLDDCVASVIRCHRGGHANFRHARRCGRVLARRHGRRRWISGCIDVRWHFIVTVPQHRDRIRHQSIRPLRALSAMPFGGLADVAKHPAFAGPYAHEPLRVSDAVAAHLILP